MVRAQGGNPDFYFLFGLGLSNALVALGGALFSQSARFADVTTVSAPLFLVGRRHFGSSIIARKAPFGWFYWPVCWALFYTVWLSPLRSAWDIWLASVRFKLVTAVLVALALIVPKLRARLAGR